jgi:hypothetical protein
MEKFQLLNDAFLGRFEELEHKLFGLSVLAVKEKWSFESTIQFDEHRSNYPILRNYLIYTYDRLKYEKKIVYSPNQDCMVFNTGLLTRNDEEIFAYFVLNTRYPIYTDQMWYLLDFICRSDYRLSVFEQLPDTVNFAQELRESVFDHSRPLDIDYNHIIIKNRDRLMRKHPDYPLVEDSELEIFFTAAIRRMISQLKRDIHFAVPHYYFDRYNSRYKMQLMVPISMFQRSQHDLVLIIQIDDNRYVAKTIIEKEWAYINARNITKPSQDWLYKIIND